MVGWKARAAKLAPAQRKEDRQRCGESKVGTRKKD
jgi:hypothetical protein